MQQTLSNSFMLLKLSFLNDAYFCMCIKIYLLAISALNIFHSSFIFNLKIYLTEVFNSIIFQFTVHEVTLLIWLWNSQLPLEISVRCQEAFIAGIGG